jgi:hypothetical protein
MLWAVPLYVVLTAAGILGRQPWCSMVALVVLVGALAWSRLRGSLVASTLYLAASAAALAAVAFGAADAVLDALPVLVNAALALFFAATLRHGEVPLVTRIVRVIEGPEHLERPGVAGYTRGLTLAWALLLGMQTLLLAGLWLLLHAPALTRAWPLANAGGTWLHGYARLGCYVLITLFFLLEYAWRRWHLRHLDHPGFFAMLSRIALHWPEILSGAGR